MPEVSVLITNYNHANYLQRRIESVLKQTYQDFEIIILDDASTDHSHNVIEKFRYHPKVTGIYYNTENSGSAFAQWEKGVGLAKGKFIWIAETDDYCEPSFLETVLNPMLYHNSVMLSFCQAVYVTPAGKILGTSAAGEIDAVYDGRNFVAQNMLGLNGIPNVSLAVFRKNAFEHVNPKYRKMTYCGDWYFWISIALQGHVAVSGRLLSYFLRHEQNVSGGAEKNGLFFLEGNSFFREVTEKCEVDENLVKNAVQMKVRRFMDTKHEMNASVIKSVKKSLFQLHPDAQSAYQRSVIKKTISRFIPNVIRLR